MNSIKVTEICNPDKKWTLEEANDLLSLLRFLSKKHDIVINDLLRKQGSYFKLGNTIEMSKLDAAIKEELVRWGSKLIKLGCKYYSGFILFDCGSGYYSWQTTEPKVEYFSYYTESLINRKKILEPQK